MCLFFCVAMKLEKYLQESKYKKKSLETERPVLITRNQVGKK